MKKLFAALLLSLAMMQRGYGQGTFVLDTDTAPTRLVTIDGPLAGPGIWAQALGGFTVESLEPVGVPVQHLGGGFVLSTIIVPWANISQTIYVQMVAWDGTVWGTNLANVPVTQFGHTDIIPMFLTSPTASPLPTLFNLPAVVPAVPEPSTVGLLCFGGLCVALFSRRLWQ